MLRNGGQWLKAFGNFQMSIYIYSQFISDLEKYVVKSRKKVGFSNSRDLSQHLDCLSTFTVISFVRN